ncbi:MAG TPA: PQQ-binding-like beta-propeller repeat protein [Planctomycetota bacterium]|nr:PQQ-binding-like beta-propeller repeat protein [Planctomycetota bacterium]
MRICSTIRAIAFVFAVSVAAADYPQWRGPNRDGISPETGLLKEWPKDGPKLAWKKEGIGGGWSTPSVAGGKIFLIVDKDKKESALALDEKDGNQIWSTELGAVGGNASQAPQYPGSRSTPTVDGEFVYCLGSDGDLACLDVAKGGVKWKKNLKTDFGGKAGMWAYAESPLIDGGTLIATPGGDKATLVALNKKTGDTIWMSAVPGGDAASYSSAIVALVAGAKEYIQFVHGGVIGVDAATGKFLWRDSRTKDAMANISTPLFYNDMVFSGSGRAVGGVVKLAAADGGVQATPVYKDVALATGIGGAIRVGENLYTCNRQLVCAEFATGKVLWEDKSIGPASLCFADGHLYLHGHNNGTVALVEASPAGYKEKGRFTPTFEIKPNQAWSYPVVANGRLYVRDVNVLCAYEVK